MNVKRWTKTMAAAALVGFVLSANASAATNDREYLLGDDLAEGASNGGTVSITFDSEGVSGMNQLIDMTAVGSPVYRTITGRPDGGGGLGIEFNGTTQYLRGSRLGLPSTSFSAINEGNGVGTLNYNGLNNRGLQFWVQPGGSGAQSLVMDTTQHGARINASGNFSMRYAGGDFDSNVAASNGTWYHVMVVRPDGPANGSRMYVDGVAVAAAPGGYDGANMASLVVGSNTDGDDQNFTGGTEEFFDGIIDDLTLFVIGDNSANPGPPQGQDWGDFEFATDNAFAAFAISGIAGDVDNNGTLNDDDKTDFINGWMSENLVNDIRVGDLNSLGNGDLNFDGITDIQDLVILQNALTSNGLGAITAAELAGSAVPEPASALLLLLGAAGAIAFYRQRL